MPWHLSLQNSIGVPKRIPYFTSRSHFHAHCLEVAFGGKRKPKDFKALTTVATQKYSNTFSQRERTKAKEKKSSYLLLFILNPSNSPFCSRNPNHYLDFLSPNLRETRKI